MENHSSRTPLYKHWYLVSQQTRDVDPMLGLMLGQRRRDRPTVVQRQMVVSAHFTSKQKLSFAYKDPENPGKIVSNFHVDWINTKGEIASYKNMPRIISLKFRCKINIFGHSPNIIKKVFIFIFLTVCSEC